MNYDPNYFGNILHIHTTKTSFLKLIRIENHVSFQIAAMHALNRQDNVM